MPGIPTPVYASLYPVVGVHCLYMPSAVVPVLYIEVLVMPRCALFSDMLKKRGLPEEETGLSPLRINPGNPGNLPNMAKKPATESSVAQGLPKSPNPSGTVTKPPLRLWPALSPVSLLG